ncbi:LysR family transcriptional regulator [Streptomyces sp. NPDC051940]|uniref:LysR family transcriptional regulator n=1 Tax=Streptomyces sp. NPDC051940 TaxID=3155675 RepID=UPI0034468CD3
MDLEIRHLRALSAIAEHGSVTRAAAALGVSQPALTAQLRRIEGVLGGEVFLRGRRGVEPTPFGEFVLSRTRAALGNIDDLLSRTPGAAAGAGAVVRFGAYESRLTVAVEERLAALLPEARTELQVAYYTGLLLDRVAAGRLDGALLADYPGFELRPPASVRWAAVATDPVHVVLPADHRAAGAGEVRLADLAEEDWVVPPSDGTGWPEHLLRACEQAGFRPRARYQLEQTGMRTALVAAGRAVSACQALHPPMDGVVVRPLAGEPMRMRLLLVWHRDGALAGCAQDLVAAVREEHRAASREAAAVRGG